MAISINFGTKVITIPQGDLTPLGGSLYELNTETLRGDINALMDDEAGMPYPDSINHNTEVVLAGVTYARTIEFINGYTITFSTEASPYRVNLVGSNNNLTDVLNLSDASVILSNSAGLIAGQAEWTQAEKDLQMQRTRAMAAGRIQVLNNQMIIRDTDDVVVATFDLFDVNGDPTSDLGKAVDRRPV